MSPREKHSWLAYCRPSSTASLRLFCFPYAGAGASVYRGWDGELPREVDVCPVQLPGRETRFRERAHTRIGPMVDAAGRALLPYLDKPFCLFGHSMGALVSFELARYLRREHGLSPAMLIVSGAGAPQVPYRSTLRHDLSDDEMMRELAQLKATPPEVLASAELMQLILPVLRADLEVCERYEYAKDAPLPCPIRVHGGEADPWTPRADLQGWGEHTRAGCVVQTWPGGHFFFQKDRRAFLQALGRTLLPLLA